MESKAVGPDEFLGDEFVTNLAQFVEEGTFLPVDVEAVSKTHFFLAKQDFRLHNEGIRVLASTLPVTGQNLLSQFLPNPH